LNAVAGDISQTVARKIDFTFGDVIRNIIQSQRIMSSTSLFSFGTNDSFISKSFQGLK